jgi:uncharacterized protein YndB with AHSA1/START domain
MLWKILLAIAIVIILLIIFIAMQPGSFRIARSILISAPPQTVFNQITDFHKWDAWSPWLKMDPNVKQTYEGPSSGPGATYSWSGNKKIGAGRMTITDTQTPDLIRIKLEFFQPFAATNDTEFTFKPEANQTNLTWAMTGQRPFMMKAFGLIMNMDKLVGNDFQKGLASIKQISESSKSDEQNVIHDAAATV